MKRWQEVRSSIAFPNGRIEFGDRGYYVGKKSHNKYLFFFPNDVPTINYISWKYIDLIILSKDEFSINNLGIEKEYLEENYSKEALKFIVEKYRNQKI